MKRYILLLLILLVSCEQINEDAKQTDAKMELLELLSQSVSDPTISYSKEASSAGQEIHETVSNIDAEWKEKIKYEIEKANNKGYGVIVEAFQTENVRNCYVYFYDTEQSGRANGVACFRDDGLILIVARSLYWHPVVIVAEGYSYEEVVNQAREIINN